MKKPGSVRAHAGLDQLRSTLFERPNTMKLQQRPSMGNRDVDLIAWGERQPRDDMPATVRRIAKRYGLLPATAMTLADAYGIGGAQ